MHLSETVDHIRSEMEELMELLNNGDGFEDYFSDGKVFEQFHSEISRKIAFLVKKINNNPTKALDLNFETYFNK